MLNVITFSRVIWMRCLYCTGVKSIASLRSCYMTTVLQMIVLIQVTRMISTFYSFVHCFLSHPHLLYVWILLTWQTANVKPYFGKLPIIVKPVPLGCTGHENTESQKIQKKNGIKIFIYSEALQIIKGLFSLILDSKKMTWSVSYMLCKFQDFTSANNERTQVAWRRWWFF